MKISLEYIAGLFDGEGHVSITWTTRRGSKDPKLCVKLCNTYYPVMVQVQKMFGGSMYKPKPAKVGYLQVYHLGFSVTESKYFLNEVLPFLIIKKEQTTVALEFSKTVYRRGRGKVTQVEKDIRDRCMIRIAELKQEQWI